MRWIVRIAVALVACVLVAVGLLFMLPADRIGQIASDQLERQTGRKLTLSGEFRPTLYPVLGARTGAVTISNADWATEPQMVTAEAAAVGVDLAALIGGDVRVETLRLVRPVVYLERAGDGRVNWDLGSAAGSDAAPQSGDAGGGADFSLELGEIEDGRVIYTDRATGQVTRVDGLTGTVSLPAGAPGATLTMAATVNDTPAQVSLSVEDRAALMAGVVSHLTAEVAAFDSRAAFSGRAGLADGTPVLDGTLDATLADPGALAARFGASLPAQAAGLRNARFNGAVKLGQTLAVDGTLGGSLDGTALDGRLSLATGADWMTRPAADTDLSLTATGVADFAFKGRVDAGSAERLLDGQLTLNAGDLRRLLAMAGVAFDPPKGAFRSATFSGPVRLAQGGALSLPDARIKLDQNAVAGAISVQPGDRPFVTATLTAGALDLSPFTGDSGGSAAGSGGAAGSGWSKEPIAVEGLDAINADIALRADSVNLGPTQLGATDIAARLRDGRMTMTLNRVRAFDGTLTGSIAVRGGGAISFDSNIRAEGIQLEPLLGQLAGITRLTGSGTTQLALSGSGGSMDALMRSLSGKGNVELGNGTIRGIDLARVMQSLKAVFGGFEGATEFTSLTGTFDMDKGVLQNVDLSLVSPLFRAGGKGSVDVGGQAMNYVVSPTRFAQGAEFTVPVTITGPWSKLKFQPDLEALANLLMNGDFKNSAELAAAQAKLAELRGFLDDPEAAISDKVKGDLERRLGKELNFEPGTGDTGASLEDRVKQGLQDKLLEKLGGNRPAPAEQPGGGQVAMDTQPAQPQTVEDLLKQKLLKELGGTPQPAPAPQVSGTGTALALSTPGTRPRLRPAGLDTSDVYRPTEAAVSEPAPEAEPAQKRVPRNKEEAKDALEDAAKKELKKLFKLGN